MNSELRYYYGRGIVNVPFNVKRFFIDEANKMALSTRGSGFVEYYGGDITETLVDGVRFLFDSAGNLVGKVAEVGEAMTRAAAWSLVKSTFKIGLKAPLLTFLVFAYKNPAQAIQMAMKGLELSVTALGFAAQIAVKLYKLISPTERRNAAIREEEEKLKNLEKLLYIQDITEKTALFQRVPLLAETINMIVGSLLEAAQDSEAIQNARFLADFRNDILKDDSDMAWCMRIALTQATTFENEETGRFFYRGFNFAKYKSNAQILLSALQNIVADDVIKRGNASRKMARSLGEQEERIVQRVSENVLNAMPALKRQRVAADEIVLPSVPVLTRSSSDDSLDARRYAMQLPSVPVPTTPFYVAAPKRKRRVAIAFQDPAYQ